MAFKLKYIDQVHLSGIVCLANRQCLVDGLEASS